MTPSAFLTDTDGLYKFQDTLMKLLWLFLKAH